MRSLDIKSMSIPNCVVCGATEFASKEVLWQKLIDAWQLSKEEVHYINRQQGFCCQKCGNNLRAMALAMAILRLYGQTGTLSEFCSSSSDLSVLEINAAGNLTQFLRKLAGHRLIEYPQYDLTNLEIESDAFDLVVHSDSLEHVPYPDRALSECRRVLRMGGHCIFTVPIIVGRMTRSRQGLSLSYHGQADINAQDQLVHTEFGVDIWTYVLEAGFISCDIVALEYPSALAIIARK
jgi:SAM-dependent methyltransferase